MRVNLADLVAEPAVRAGERPALTYKARTLSYAELWSAVERCAHGLAALGVQREERVAIYLDKRIETVEAVFATAAARGVFVPVNPLLKAAQVGYILADSDAAVLVTTPDRLALLVDQAGSMPALRHVLLVGDGPVADRWQAAGVEVGRWDGLGGSTTAVEAAPGTAAAVDLDVAAILYTSGSTGRPKGVVLSHRNLLVGAESVSGYLGNGAEDVILAALPLSFDAGFSQLTTAFAVGAHVILMNYLVPGEVVRLCAAHGVTGLTCVPPLWIQLAAQDWPAEVAGRLRYFANTGGRMPKATLDRLRSTFTGAAPFLMYGLTEAFRSTYLDPTEVDRRPDSIGKAIPNAEILVLRPDGSPCGPGEEGELVHRGPLVALGYWKQPAKTAERFRPIPGRDGDWRAPELAVWSGDAVVADDEGFLYFVGRNDDMIKTSGYRVSPTEVEEAAYATGLVGDAVALGVEHSVLGQTILLVATSATSGDLDPAEVTTRMRRMLPGYMVPAEVVVRSSLPRSPNGKFDRVLLRAELVPGAGR